jgi:hypothetical protein
MVQYMAVATHEYALLVATAAGSVQLLQLLQLL